jgi:dCTP deaminase
VTVLSGQTIRRLGILTPCVERTREHGLTHGLGPSGYDLRLDLGGQWDFTQMYKGDFRLAATLEHFQMPRDVIGVVHDKSTLARQGLSVFNTIIEPGWDGYLTLELVYHGAEPLRLHRGQAIAQVVFHFTDEPVERPYDGKYQHQEAGPQGPRT